MKTKLFKYGATIALVTYAPGLPAEVHYYYGIPQIEIRPEYTDTVPRILRINVSEWAEKNGITFKETATI